MIWLLIFALFGFPILGLIWEVIKAAFSVVFVVILIVGCLIALCCGNSNSTRTNYNYNYSQNR